MVNGVDDGSSEDQSGVMRGEMVAIEEVCSEYWEAVVRDKGETINLCRALKSNAI